MKKKPTAKKRGRPPGGDKISNQIRLALEISEQFQISCTNKTVQTWQKRWTPPFPASDSHGGYSRKECFDWIKNIYLPKMGAVGRNAGADKQSAFLLGELAKSRRQIISEAREQFRLDQERGLYMLRADAARESIAVFRQFHAFTRTEFERNLTETRREKLTELGASPELIAAFYDFDLALARAAVDRIEQYCAEEAAK